MKDNLLIFKINRETELQYFNNLETLKHLKPFWDKYRPWYFNKHVCGDSKLIFIEKKETSAKKKKKAIVAKETLLGNNDEIGKTFNINFPKR